MGPSIPHKICEAPLRNRGAASFGGGPVRANHPLEDVRRAAIKQTILLAEGCRCVLTTNKQRKARFNYLLRARS